MTLMYKSNPKPLELWRKRGDLDKFQYSFISEGELKIVDPNEARPVGSVDETTDVAYFCLYVTRDGGKCCLDWYLRNHKRLLAVYEKIGEVQVISNGPGKWKDFQIINHNKETNLISLDGWYEFVGIERTGS